MASFLRRNRRQTSPHREMLRPPCRVACSAWTSSMSPSGDTPPETGTIASVSFWTVSGVGSSFNVMASS